MKLLPRKYKTARAVIIQDKKMLAFHRKRKDRSGQWIEYYSIPGGQIDHGETPEHAVVRELQEEMGVQIKENGQVAHYKGLVFEHYIYSAEIVSGKARFMSDSEEAQEYVSTNNQYQVVWVPVEQLSVKNLRFYGMFLEHIIALSEGKEPDAVKHIKVPRSVY